MSRSVGPTGLIPPGQRRAPRHQEAPAVGPGAEFTPAEQPGHPGQQCQPSVLAALARAIVPPLVFDGEDELAPDSIALNRDVRYGAGRPVAHRVREHLGQEEPEAAADRQRRLELVRPVDRCTEWLATAAGRQ